MDGSGTSGTDVVRALFACYLGQDRRGAEHLVAADFVFTSPQDDRIDRAAWFARCFPTADRFASCDLLAVAPLVGEDVVVLYEYDLADGSGRYRNVEVITVTGGAVRATQVFFGGRA